MRKDHVLILGSTGFPYEISAGTEKNKYISKALIEAGFDVSLLIKISSIADPQNKMASDGFYEGIYFKYLNNEVNKSKGFINRFKSFISGSVNEIRYLKKIKKKNNQLFIFLSYSWFHLLIYYWILSKIFSIKIIISIMEWHIDQKNRKFLHRVNGYLFDNLSFHFATAAIPISEFIKTKITKRRKNISVFKLPVLTDFILYKKDLTHSTFKSNYYFLYCGHIGYIEIIDFVVDCFEVLLKSGRKLKLILVINGGEGQLLALKKALKDRKLDGEIEVRSKIPFEELIQLYRNAKSLLIPLRETNQDKARFPQKIAEYTASMNPIITNNWGEVSFFFKDRINALVCDRFDQQQFIDKMNFIIDNPTESNEIGKRGYKTGVKSFDYRSYVESLSDFLRKL